MSTDSPNLNYVKIILCIFKKIGSESTTKVYLLIAYKC